MKKEVFCIESYQDIILDNEIIKENDNLCKKYEEKGKELTEERINYLCNVRHLCSVKVISEEDKAEDTEEETKVSEEDKTEDTEEETKVSEEDKTEDTEEETEVSEKNKKNTKNKNQKNKK